MTLKKCLSCSTAAFLAGLLIGCCVLSHRYSLQSIPEGSSTPQRTYCIDGLTGETWSTFGQSWTKIK